MSKHKSDESKVQTDARADFDRHALQGEGTDAVPMPEDGGHARSAAAHLGTSAQPHTKPAGNLRQGASPGQLREPPMVLSRIGKQTRKG